MNSYSFYILKQLTEDGVNGGHGVLAPKLAERVNAKDLEHVQIHGLGVLVVSVVRDRLTN